MIRFFSLSFLLLAGSFAITTACDKDFEAEWMTISANNTRRVFNVVVGSLFNHGATQFTQANRQMPSNQPIETITTATSDGLKRELRGCGRFHSMRGVECEKDEDCRKNTAYFEVMQDEWEQLRIRECSYDKFVPAEIVDSGAPEGFYFAWGRDPDSTCNPAPVYDRISQSYWDFIIGGILAWDGMLTDSGRFTWDLEAELKLGEETMATLVHKMPSLSYQVRYDFALEFIKTTQPSNDILWMDDRKCPFTGNAPITPASMVDYRYDAFKGKEVSAIGTAGPLMTQNVYDIIDNLMIEGGFAYGGAKNNIENRTDPCGESERIGIDRSEFASNLYYDDIVEWRAGIEFGTEEHSESHDDKDDSEHSDSHSHDEDGEHSSHNDDSLTEDASSAPHALLRLSAFGSVVLALVLMVLEF